MTETATQGERASTAAVVTYIALGLLVLDAIGIFVLVAMKIEVKDVMVGIIGGMLSTHATIAIGAAGFWVAGTAGSKATNAALVKSALEPTATAP